MIAGVVASNSRPRPFISGLNFIQPGATNSSTTPSWFGYGNNEYVFHDTTQFDIMTSSSPLSGYSDVVTTDAIAGNGASGAKVFYENARYFIVDRTNSAGYTGTALNNTMTSFTSDDIRAKVIWYSAGAAWVYAGTTGGGTSGLLKTSINGTTWTSRTAPTNLRTLGLATNGTRMVVCSEGSTGTANQVRYTTSTNVASLVWTDSTNPIASNRDLSNLEYHAAKDTWTYTSPQSTLCFSTDGGVTFTAKSPGFSANGTIVVAWIPWHNMWIAIQEDLSQIAYSNTPDIAGTWTVTSTSIAGGGRQFVIDPNKKYVLIGTRDNKFYWAV